MLIVGGNWNNGSNAGVRTANANNSASNSNNNIGFRLANCALKAVRALRIAANVHVDCTSHETPAIQSRNGGVIGSGRTGLHSMIWK